MRFRTLHKLEKLFGVLVAAVAAGVVLLGLFAVHVLYKSQQRYYAAAEETSRNLAITLQYYFHAHFQETDLALRRGAQEYTALHQQGRYDEARYRDYVAALRERLPQARAVRGADARGRVVYGEEIDPAHPQDLGIREFFQRARSERGLIFGAPLLSRINNELVLPLAYALTLPDGGFGGALYANLDIRRIDQLFASLATGPHGSIVLLDDKKRVLHRYPAAPDQPPGTPIRVSAATESVLASGAQRATYRAVSARDGRERVLSLEKVGSYPVYVVVGLASEDFLAPWQKEARNASIFVSLEVMLAAALLLGVRYALRRQYDAVRRLIEADGALQGSLARLTVSESRWRSLTEGLPQMVWTAGADRRIDFMSHHWEQYSGIPASQLLASGDWRSVIHPDDLEAVRGAWDLAPATGVFRADARLRRRDGVWRMFDHHALPQRGADGAITGWVGSSTDITEVRQAHDELLRAKEAADKAGRAKSEFVANMSHEIRSPMNAVLGMLQLLQQTALNERQRDYTVKAHAAASALLGLLNDILDFSKVEAGKLSLDPHRFCLDKLWRDLAVILSANVGDKQVEVLFRIDPALPSWIVADALRLQQVLLNLAGNAIKFTERGEVVLSARPVARPDGRMAIAFAISDSGIGISEEQCRRIFDGFAQAEASTARRYGGTGLGLAISARLVRLMGGRLQVRSVLGQGSTFEFEMDCEPAEAPPAAQSMPASAATGSALQALQDLRCLVVDDNPTARTVLAEMAASFGWRADAVESGEQALAAVSAPSPGQGYDVVFIDWRMPGLDGWETSLRLRALAPSGRLPLVVMVTAHDRELLAQRQAGMGPVLDGVVVKPVTASMLFDAVADARLGRAPAAQAPPPATRRLAGLRLLLVEDNLTNQQVASELLANEGAAVDIAGSGRAALQALAALDGLEVLEGPGPGAPPDLVLMDIQMPDMDGYATTAALRSRLAGRCPPIVAMTANAMPSDRTAALAAGMVDHIGKPFDLDQLVEVILRHARRPAAPDPAPEPAPDPASAARSTTPAAQVPPATFAMPAMAATPSTPATPPVPSPAPEVTGLDSAAALKRMGGLQQVYLLALRSFAAEAGKLAARMEGARAAHDRGAALGALHTLKGLAGTIGASQLATLCAQAEWMLKDLAEAGVVWQPLEAVLAALPAVLDACELMERRLAA
ncbi:response regulator [Oxalobacteraceae bacterium A2-2]